MSASAVVSRLHAFVEALRLNGARPATNDLIDAVRALQLLGDAAVATRAALHATLSCTLSRSLAEADIFDRVFELYFGATPDEGAPAMRALRDALLARGVDAVRAERLVAELLLTSGAHHAVLDAFLAGDPERLAELVDAAIESTDFEGLRSPLQIGYFTRRLMTRLGVDEIEQRFAAAAGGAGDREGAALAGAGAEVLEQLRRRARRAAERELQKRTVVAARRAQLVDRDLRTLDARDLEELRAHVRRLAARLRTRLAVRQRRAARGKVDVKRTVRASVATGGVPFSVQRARRRRRRADLVVVCDVSDSVRQASLFMLELVAALADAFRRTRSFVFVDRVGEVTALFSVNGHAPSTAPDAAIAAILAGDVVPVSNNSDYGRALRDLYAIAGTAITRRTVVVILGDGRSNYRAPEAWVLAELRRRARRVLWLSPEERGTWGYGDSELPRYARHADAILVVRSAADLARAIDEIAVL
ncbi:MAG: VWA domain-containing protein [Deltaproteobacteria bacterium]|nr:VWA domain-containing protein [Deltaproteobacteria bacterium]